MVYYVWPRVMLGVKKGHMQKKDNEMPFGSFCMIGCLDVWGRFAECLCASSSRMAAVNLVLILFISLSPTWITNAASC